MRNASLAMLCAGLSLSVCRLPGAEAKKYQIDQYGISWTFDQPREVGRFATGDWWVVGPVTVVAVSPGPGAASAELSGGDVKSIYGAAAMRADARMRNGSMVSPKPRGDQGYDSRLGNYKPELSAAYPLSLKPGDTLVSTISNETLPVEVLHHALMWSSEKRGALALKSAAILTVVPAPPPADAFRPPYTGWDGRTFYRTGDLRRDLLPTLSAPAGGAADWTRYERYMERPWLDHTGTWLLQHLGPSENQVNYGREFSRITSVASLMLMLDAPRERKEKLMTGLVQFGIDVRGLAEAGRNWNADGGHWNGRKWPMLFAGLMLGDEGFAKQAAKTIFSEDQQTYYGRGAQGATALYQVVYHTHPKQPYEEKTPVEWTKDDKLAENYRIVVSGGLPGTALAVQLMKAKALWNHDAFFDYYDRWMAKDDAYAAGRAAVARPKQEGRALDPFVNAMWEAYRPQVPPQAGARENLKWVWTEGRKGEFAPDSPPSR